MTEDILLKRITEIGLSRRAVRCLNSGSLGANGRAGYDEKYKITYVSELVQMTEGELLRIESLGRITLDEIKNKLADLGLSLL